MDHLPINRFDMAKPKFKISTTDCGSEKALSFWEEHLSQIGHHGQIIPHAPDEFFASAEVYEFGKSTLYFHKRSSSIYQRTSAVCAYSPLDVFVLSYLKSGDSLYEQGGRSSHVHSQDCFMFYAGEPMRSDRFNTTDAITLIFPSSFIKGWVPNPYDITAVPFSTQSNWGKALASTLNALTPDLDALAVTPDAIVDQINCLLALAAGQFTPAPKTYGRAMFCRLRQALHTHYSNPALNPALLAKEQGISTRTLYASFANSHTSFRKELFTLRIEKAREYLDDPRLNKKSILEIASLVGYHHASHFITHFRKKFGVSPAVYRKLRRS
jgi:AraC-like DNA-binding protein